VKGTKSGGGKSAIRLPYSGRRPLDWMVEGNATPCAWRAITRAASTASRSVGVDGDGRRRGAGDAGGGAQNAVAHYGDDP